MAPPPLAERARRGAVVVLAADSAAAEPLAALGAELDAATAAMAPRVPVALDRPLTVAAEPDHVAQAVRAGAVGEAVAGGPADVHLVLHPDDGFAYRHAAAAALLRRAGLADGLPPYLLDGAALWLSGDWYGRPWRGWLPDLAAAEVLPAADELLAAEPPPDGSRLLWTPVAAAVVDRLPGSTVVEKVSSLPSRSAVAALLERIAAEASAAPAGVAPARPRAPLPPFVAGVSLAMRNSLDGGYHAPSVVRVLDRLAGLGADAVSLMPFAFQAAPDAPGLRYLNRRPRSETDAGMVHAARRARERGFVVLWKPQIWLRGSWSGEIAMANDAAWAAWWRSYRRFLVHQAALAEWTGAEVLSVGTELGGTLEREAEWRRAIAAVRRVYRGRLTYAANWHGDFDRVPFWDRLDLLGIDAYRPLAAAPDASPRQLAVGARAVARDLAVASRRHGKRVLLTEVGYAARRAPWTSPHEEGGELSPEDQAAAYRALFAGLGRPDWLAGLFVWKAFSDEAPGAAASERPDFRFLGRPAEAAIRDAFRGRHRPAAPGPAAPPLR
ncbi:MAG TPA: hypothetical protein VHM02_05460 [Thermoanaerobaculia bacterium]|nr:hypothetical protein [Thermoanaerobaculia bacterium]